MIVRLSLEMDFPIASEYWHNLDVPFHSGGDGLIRIDAVYNIHPEGAASLGQQQEEIALVVPVSNIISLAQTAQRPTSTTHHLVWEKWGPQSTRLTRSSKAGLWYKMYGAHGISMVESYFYIRDGEWTASLSLWDFGKAGVNKLLSQAGSATFSGSNMVTLPDSDFGPSAVFKDQNIRTTLPARTAHILIDMPASMHLENLVDLIPGENCFRLHFCNVSLGILARLLYVVVDLPLYRYLILMQMTISTFCRSRLIPAATSSPLISMSSSNSVAFRVHIEELETTFAALLMTKIDPS